MNRKFLDELYRKYFVLDNNRDSHFAMHDFDSDASIKNHEQKGESILTQQRMLSEIIDDYISAHNLKT